MFMNLRRSGGSLEIYWSIFGIGMVYLEETAGNKYSIISCMSGNGGSIVILLYGLF